MPKGFTEAERTRITERLIDEGERMFGRYGLKKTSVEEICEAAGIAKGSFYSFFPSKEELFMQAMERRECRFREDLLTRIGQEKLTPREQLRELLMSLITLFETDEITRAIVNPETMEHLMRKLPPERAMRHMEADAGFHTRLMERWRRQGARLRIDLDLFPEVVKALFFIALQRDVPGFAYEKAVTFLVDAVTEAVFEPESEKRQNMTAKNAREAR